MQLTQNDANTKNLNFHCCVQHKLFIFQPDGSHVLMRQQNECFNFYLSTIHIWVAIDQANPLLQLMYSKKFNFLQFI